MTDYTDSFPCLWQDLCINLYSSFPAEKCIFISNNQFAFPPSPQASSGSTWIGDKSTEDWQFFLAWRKSKLVRLGLSLILLGLGKTQGKNCPFNNKCRQLFELFVQNKLDQFKNLISSWKGIIFLYFFAAVQLQWIKRNAENACTWSDHLKCRQDLVPVFSWNCKAEELTQ